MRTDGSNFNTNVEFTRGMGDLTIWGMLRRVWGFGLAVVEVVVAAAAAAAAPDSVAATGWAGGKGRNDGQVGRALETRGCCRRHRHRCRFGTCISIACGVEFKLASSISL